MDKYSATDFLVAIQKLPDEEHKIVLRYAEQLTLERDELKEDLRIAFEDLRDMTQNYENLYDQVYNR